MSDVNTAARAAGPTQASRLARVRMATFGAVTMLILQYILGMIYNLYGTAPTATKSIGLFSSPVLALHVIMSLLLLISAIMLLIRAIGAGHRLTIAMSAAGLAGIVAAGFAGLAFTSKGSSGASLGMALAFVVSLACYIVIIFVLPPSQSASTT
jgi:heme A synthase